MRLFEDVSPPVRDSVEYAVRPWQLRNVHRDPTSFKIVATITLDDKVFYAATSPSTVANAIYVKPLSRLAYTGPYAPRRAMRARAGL